MYSHSTNATRIKLCLTSFLLCFYADAHFWAQKNKWSEGSMLIHSNVDTSTFLMCIPHCGMEAVARATHRRSQHATNHFSCATLTYLFGLLHSRIVAVFFSADKWLCSPLCKRMKSKSIKMCKIDRMKYLLWNCRDAHWMQTEIGTFFSSLSRFSFEIEK